MRLILSGPRRAATTEEAAEFAEFATGHGLDLDGAWVAARRPQVAGGPGDDSGADAPPPAVVWAVVWAVLPIASPGRTMLLSTPGRLPAPADRPAVAALASAVCGHFAAAGVELAQVLLDPDCGPVIEAHAAAGFSRLAELIYLRRDVPAGAGLPDADLPPGGSLVPYSDAARDRFGGVILASYDGSADCPALDGRRDAADILDGHAAAGEFAPDLWSLLVVDGRDAGVLLLNRMAGGDGLELVYVGLAPWARGRGWSDALMDRAVVLASAEAGRRLTLAVDGANAPGLALYRRHGFHELYRRVALIRDLREA